MEKAFELAEVKDDKKAQYTSYYLKDESSYWWESSKAFLEGEVVTWEKFTKMFLEKYLPIYMQDQLKMRILNLRQEDMTVTEYEVKFSELARFVHEYVNTKAKKAKRFQQRLKPWILSQVALLEIRTYAALKGQYSTGCPSGAGKPEMACFKYGEVGHMERNCKEPVQKENVLRIARPAPPSTPAGQPRARTFNMTMKDAVQNVDVVAGCEAYLAHVKDVETESFRIEDISVVKDFHDVFPDKLTGLPADREIEFTIDLAPGTKPVSKAPYRMAPVEMQGLATKLEELLSKGLIRPSLKGATYFSKIDLRSGYH
ncbi:uncharacterized protein LOC141686298 [Apium graveolens]|uniref:uncharacterized protein LOC141686298 n=1 Tax=Apium graveolens TaxID=4045 RepID=UPI003D78FEF1